MASLQSTLDVSELREQTLRTWALFIQTLKYADVAPFIGLTTGALVASWKTFTDVEKTIATSIIKGIIENPPDSAQYLSEIVSMDDIPELASIADRILKTRRSQPIKVQINDLLKRINSKNDAVAITSMREFLRLISTTEMSNLLKADYFDPTVSRAINQLLAAATNDGGSQAVRELSGECLGVIGALDPDRLSSTPSDTRLVLSSNFSDKHEAIEFVIRLIRDLLVDAFRATNDTKHQKNLAFAIQELLKFCGFTPKILQASTATPKLWSDWQKLRDQAETLTPLLESRFSLTDVPRKEFGHPIYKATPTYREWIQDWTTDLVNKVMNHNEDDRATQDSKTIFGVFRGVLRNQDVTVAHYILPHLVLNVLLSGVPRVEKEIEEEINAVLHDQVNASGPADKRNLSAQVVFDLMDYLSQWLQSQRGGRPDRRQDSNTVHRVISGVDTELMANAALKSRAYARSLRGFENRIVKLREEKKANADLQTYYERLHQIYAELDEPDGMEGVSSFVFSPSLEHQIREHEMTGRWTSAQSCWEVRLQQSPEDLHLHVGLLKCLRNLGHYGEAFPLRFSLLC
jgi:serine/threonine-protein kinase ATR